MRDSGSRLFIVFGLILVVWVGTYWLYEPHAGLAVTRDAPLGVSGAANAPPPRITLDPVQGPQAPKPDLASAVEPATPAPAMVAPPVEPQLKLQAPQFREYVVQRGDAGWRQIAARAEVFGDADKWVLVARANPLVSPDRLKPGKTVLKIPLDPGNIQGRLVTLGPDGSVWPAPGGADEAAKQADPAATTYTVSPSDSLWSISKKVYGKGALWKTIYEANRSIIKDPDRPTPGTVLTIPASPS